MNEKQFRRYLDRDAGCVHCGSDGPDVVPHHRLNRGMGSAKSRHVPSNIVAMCSLVNGWMEDSKGDGRAMIEAYGWKLRDGQDPRLTPVWNAHLNKWFLLDDDYGKEEVNANY